MPSFPVWPTNRLTVGFRKLNLLKHVLTVGSTGQTFNRLQHGFFNIQAGPPFQPFFFRFPIGGNLLVIQHGHLLSIELYYHFIISVKICCKLHKSRSLGTTTCWSLKSGRLLNPGRQSRPECWSVSDYPFTHDKSRHISDYVSYHLQSGVILLRRVAPDHCVVVY